MDAVIIFILYRWALQPEVSLTVTELFIANGGAGVGREVL